MSSLNRAIVLGNLGSDPEVRYTSGGAAVATLSIATNERWKDKSGQTQERTEWHRVVVWGKQAELCRDYLAKGRTVLVEGRIQTRKWEDKQGQARYTTEIVAQSVRFIGGGKGDHQPVQVSGNPMGASASPLSNASEDGPPPFDSEDDIPF